MTWNLPHVSPIFHKRNKHRGTFLKIAMNYCHLRPKNCPIPIPSPRSHHCHLLVGSLNLNILKAHNTHQQIRKTSILRRAKALIRRRWPVLTTGRATAAVLPTAWTRLVPTSPPRKTIATTTKQQRAKCTKVTCTVGNQFPLSNLM